jgi:C-terminal processing protease CtpA/Prc
MDSDTASENSFTPKQQLQQQPKKIFAKAARNLIKFFKRTKLSDNLNTSSNMSQQQSNRIPLTTSSVNANPMSLAGFETVKVNLKCGTELLGFTLAGYCPCYVAKLESNSSASKAGLMLGDLIIKINGKNVSRAKCDSIVRIIK